MHEAALAATAGGAARLVSRFRRSHHFAARTFANVKCATLGRPVLLALFADALDRDHAFGFGGVEHDHALGRAPGDADALDAGADELAAVGDQHDLVAVLDRERGDQLAGLLPDGAVALAHVHGDDAFAAAAGDPVLVGRGTLAVAALGNGQHELLGSRHRDVALLAKLDGLAAVEAAPHRARAPEIGDALLGAGVHVAQDRERDQPVALGQRDAAHA